jgi:hypothetical protein
MMWSRSIGGRWMTQWGYGTVDIPRRYTSTFYILTWVRETETVTGRDHGDIRYRGVIGPGERRVGVGEASTAHLFRFLLWSVAIIWMFFHVQYS